MEGRECKEKEERKRGSDAEESLARMHSGKKTQLPAEAGSQTSSDFQPPSTDTILSGGCGGKRCRGLCLNMGNSGTVISKRQRTSNSFQFRDPRRSFYLCKQARLDLERLGTGGLGHYGNSVLHPH